MPETGFAGPELIQTPAAFEALIADLRGQNRIAVDTESNSLHAYRERVCLLQFSTTDADYVLDPLALDDLAALGPIFRDPCIEKIFHAAEYDILCLRRDFGFGFSSIFDTMQAGRILGRKLAGLDRLLEDKFEVKVSKRLQKADWGARPLSQDLLQYAAQDTHYLIPLRDLLEADLREKGLLELAQEDFRMACNHEPPAHTDRTESPAWLRMRGRRDLKPKELTILKELMEWREATAARLDRPPFKVMGDDRLIGVARSQPLDLAGLQAAGLTERQVQQWGREMLEAVGRGMSNPVVGRVRPPVPSAAYLKRLEGLKEWRKKVAVGMEVESDVVLPRGLLLALAENGVGHIQSIMGPSPWRLRRFGCEIASILAGNSSSS
jgi:ribonuclease D